MATGLSPISNPASSAVGRLAIVRPIPYTTRTVKVEASAENARSALSEVPNSAIQPCSST
jgi:hypothetical protein